MTFGVPRGCASHRAKNLVDHTQFWRKKALMGPPQFEIITYGPVNYMQHAVDRCNAHSVE